ncbi:translation elongation factor Ts [Pseudochelatococcus contaminans]|uniref:Elongation factor Ts n=1 Tax=Pseudochelatococcus contaminans TaxID=1538103 RepID=A0A7W5Z574_9HYPH|nr:translation elongation factor Ts [Pseudochelatococcus contaminans]MBB3809912.1 elongation factor Ts [Pseudochelatococcus contaminans]
MANITAALVKELREKSGAGMLDCKNALTETDGDIEAAIDWLRKKGLARAAKKSSRVAAEGLVALAIDGNKGIAVELNSETDFVSRNEQFQSLAKTVADVALRTGDNVDEIKGAAYPDGGTVEETITSAIATIGENIALRRAQGISVGEGVVAGYIHNAAGDNLGRIGVLVALESTGNKDELTALARQIAMHVAATNPVALDASGVPEDVVAREKAILLEKNAGKPEHVLEKIAENGLKSYYKEVTLVEQPFIHDSSKSVAQAVKESEGKVGGPIRLAGYVRFALGDGIEKEETDFASEVAAAAGTA